jgi:hypothetical protein
MAALVLDVINTAAAAAAITSALCRQEASRGHPIVMANSITTHVNA